MFWFRIAINLALGVDLIWGLGLVTGILLMVTTGGQQQNMTTDPTMNATLTSYVFILMFQFGLIGLCFFGFFNSYRVWRNKYMMDHSLRHLFIIWVCCWGLCLLGMLAIAMYALIRLKDPQGQMGFMYEMFTKYAIDPRFVSNFERYQKDHSCCGLYGPDDWFIVQLRASPGGGGGGGGMGGFFGGGGFDDGFQQNPSTGKCHIFQPLIPPGCGPMMMKDINQKLGMYAGLTIFQVFLGIVAAVLAWYCFFYWLEKEVIVIPEDEVSNIVVIEPDDSTGSMDRRMSERPYNDRSAQPPIYYPNNNYIHQKRTGLIVHSTAQGSSRPEESMKFGPASEFRHGGHDTHLSLHPHATSVAHNSNLPLPPAMMTPSVQHFVHTSTAPIPLHHNSFVDNSFSVRTTNQNHGNQDKPKDSEEATMEKQLKTLGGKVLVKMKVDHKLDENGEVAGEESKVKKPQKATLAIVRNQHKKDPPPEAPPAHHGHTGNLAQDIAAMSGGKKLKNKIEDLVISDHPHAPPKPPETEILGSVSGFGAGSALNNLLEKGAATKAKEKQLEKQREKEADVIKPVVIGTTARLHGAGGSIIQDIAKSQEKAEKLGGGTAGPHGLPTLKYLPLTQHGISTGREHRRGTLTFTSAADFQYHTQPPATLGNLAVPGGSLAGHPHQGRGSVSYEPSMGFSRELDIGSSRIRESLLNAGSSAGRNSLIGHHQFGTASRLTAHEHRPSILSPGEHHRASIYITPHQHPRSSVYERSHEFGQSSYAGHDHRRDYDRSISSSHPQNGHRPSIFIKPKREHSRLSRVIHHHQERSRSQAPVSMNYQPHTHFGSVTPEEDHHRRAIGSLIAPPAHDHVHAHHIPDSFVAHDHLQHPPGSLILPGHDHYDRHHHDNPHHSPVGSMIAQAPIHEHDRHHDHQHVPLGSLIASTRDSLERESDRHHVHHLEPESDRHHVHHLEPESDRHLDRDHVHHLDRASDRHHDHHLDRDHVHHLDRESDRHRDRETVRHHDHPDHRHPSDTGSSRRHRSEDGAYSSHRPRYIHATQHYLDAGSLNNNRRDSRYLSAARTTNRYQRYSEAERTLPPRSRSPPRRILYEDDDEDYGYQPPPRVDHQGSSRSRSMGGGRRREDSSNARILYKNPRKLEDSD